VRAKYSLRSEKGKKEKEKGESTPKRKGRQLLHLEAERRGGIHSDLAIARSERRKGKGKGRGAFEGEKTLLSTPTRGGKKKKENSQPATS